MGGVGYHGAMGTMNSATARILSLAVFASLFALAIHLFFGSVLAAQPPLVEELVIRNFYDGEKHTIRGRVLVPSECHDLDVWTSDLDGDTIAIVLDTWEQPYRDCAEEPVPKSFEIIAFAPASIDFRGVFNGRLIPVQLVHETPRAQ